MGMETDTEDSFCIDGSDDEKYNPDKGSKGSWTPKPEDIQELYKKIAAGDTLELTWVRPERRSPSPEKMEMEVKQEVEPDIKEEKKAAPTEFDFEEVSAPLPITPIRTPGSSKAPKSSQKRVARMDKIMNDIFRHQKMGEDSKTTPKSRGGSGGAPPVRPLAKLKLKEPEDEFS